MKQVFLSHASADKGTVRKIRNALAPYVGNLWLDERELLPGDSLFGNIGSAISSSAYVLVFISTNSISSKWVTRELNAFFAEEDNRDTIMVIPIIVDDVTPPPFLSDRIQVRLTNLTFSAGIKEILKGLCRCQSVILLKPVEDVLHELAPFSTDISSFRYQALAGELRFVFDHYDLAELCLGGLVDDEWGSKERILLAWPKCFEFLSAVSTPLAQVVWGYYVRDVGAPAEVQIMLNTVWRLVFLSLLKHVLHNSNWNYVTSVPALKKSIDFLELLEQTRTERIPKNMDLGPIADIWLHQLNLHVDETYDLGFVGNSSETSDVFDANHVPVPKVVVRRDSLAQFNDTPPDAEFLPAVWVRKILSYIVAKAIITLAYQGMEPHEVIERIGLHKSDYRRFGLE